jgi:hypothetical protein
LSSVVLAQLFLARGLEGGGSAAEEDVALLFTSSVSRLWLSSSDE